MASRLTEAQLELLIDADPWTYCGYDSDVRAASRKLEHLGLGHVSTGDLGPVFTITPAGRAALEKRDE